MRINTVGHNSNFLSICATNKIRATTIKAISILNVIFHPTTYLSTPTGTTSPDPHQTFLQRLPVPPKSYVKFACGRGLQLKWSIVILWIDPPVIDTALEFWYAIVPRPRAVPAPAPVAAPVPPPAIARIRATHEVPFHSSNIFVVRLNLTHPTGGFTGELRNIVPESTSRSLHSDRNTSY